MRTFTDQREDRVAQAGADIVRISATTVRVVVDAPPPGPTWRHPVWALCRALAALGIGAVQLRAPRECYEEISLLMQGVSFTWEPEAEPGPAPGRGAEAHDILLYLGHDPAALPGTRAGAGPRSSHFAAVSCRGSRVTLLSSSGIPDAAASPAWSDAVEVQPLEPVARIAAGLALQEALIVAGRLQAAAAADPHVCFDAAMDRRTPQAEGGGLSLCWVEDAIIEVIGAGAVGTNLLESLAPLLGPGCELRVFDPDEIGPENLPVQAAFLLEDVGRPKAEVMAEKLAFICDPFLEIRPMVMRYEDRPSTLARPSLRVACVDTFAARKYLNDCALADGVPLVEAGCSPLVAQVRSYLPGRTACLACRIPHLSKRASEERGGAACSLEAPFTLPGTTMIAGGLLACEALKALRPQLFGWPSSGTVTYDARFASRFGVIETRPACRHASERG
jgi:molybdopterin/thiamine biosynthesis adenylyltransferase